MSKIALVVELKIAPGRQNEFVARARQHGENCLNVEEGCLAFDVLVPEDGSDRVFLYEIYADRKAVEAHLATPHMAAYLEDTGEMITDRTRTACRLIED